MPAPLAGVGLIVFKTSGIGLHHSTSLEKQQSQFVRRHARNEDLRFVESGTEPRHDSLRVERFAAHQCPPIGDGVIGVSPDFRNQSLWREAGRFLDRSPDDGAKRKDSVMYGQEVNKNAHFSRLSGISCIRLTSPRTRLWPRHGREKR